jgi:hypothetical protein
MPWHRYFLNLKLFSVLYDYYQTKQSKTTISMSSTSVNREANLDIASYYFQEK